MFKIEIFSDRLTEERKRLKLTQENVAAAVGVHKVTQNNYESGKRLPDAEYLSALAQLGVDINYLLQITQQQQTRENHDDVVMIPRYSARASAGNGKTIFDDEPIGYMAFMRSWIDAHQLDPEALFVLEIDGDSMGDKLQHGDSALVNRKVNHIKSDSAYVFRQDEDLKVKYLQKMLGNKLRVSSANPNYPPYDIDLDVYGDSVEIIGEVTVSMHSWIS